MTHGRTPFTNKLFSRKSTVSNAVRIKPALDETLKEIIKKTVRRNPDNRINTAEMLKLLEKF